jgi:hypothetical protein
LDINNWDKKFGLLSKGILNDLFPGLFWLKVVIHSQIHIDSGFINNG